MATNTRDVLDAQRLAYDFLVRKAHPQQPLWSASEFATQASNRGMRGASQLVLEEWQRQGVLRPVLCCYALTRRHRASRTEDGTLTWKMQPVDDDEAATDGTIEVPVPLWYSADALQAIGDRADAPFPEDTADDLCKETHDPDTLMPTVWRRYHPYQMIRLHQCLKACTHSALCVQPPSERFVQVVADGVRVQGPNVVERLRTSHAEAYRELALMLAIEDVYLPRIRGRVQNYGGIPEDPWDEWASSVQPESLLEAVLWGVEGVAELRQTLARKGWHLDPNRTLWMLFRAMAYQHRSALTGEARLSWDYYEAAETLGLFLQDVTGERQPHVDDLIGGGHFKEALYGIAAEDIDYANPTFLPALVRHPGVDARSRVLWLLEGHSECAFLDEYCSELGINLHAMGVEHHNMHGLRDAKDPALTAHIDRAITSGMVLVVTVDNESGRDELERMLKDKAGIRSVLWDHNTLDADDRATGMYFWETNFEDANFTAGQLFEGWLPGALERAAGRGLQVEEGELRAAFADYVLRSTRTSAFRILRSFAGARSLYSQKVEVARGTAAWLAMQRIADADIPLTPFEKLLQLVLATAAELRAIRVTYPGADES